MAIVKTLKKNLFLLTATFLFIYLIFTLFDGERGLLSYFEKKKIKEQLVFEKKYLDLNLKKVEKKITLLTENIDLDYLEILYREKFFYGKPYEKVYLNR